LSARGIIGKKRFVDGDNKQLEKAHSSVLQQLTLVEPYIQQHLNEIESESNGCSQDWIIKEHKHHFLSWFRDHEHQFQGDSTNEVTLTRLAWTIRQCHIMASI